MKKGIMLYLDTDLIARVKEQNGSSLSALVTGLLELWCQVDVQGGQDEKGNGDTSPAIPGGPNLRAGDGGPD